MLGHGLMAMLLEDYAKSLGADVISFIQIFIEYLLSLPSRRCDCVTFDLRTDLKACEVAIKQMLEFLPTHDHRTSIVRRSLIKMENEQG